MMSFVLAKVQPGLAVDQVCRDISARTGLLALSTDQFHWKTIWYYMRSTGIPRQFRNHDRTRLFRGGRRGRADVLPVHDREPQTIRQF